MNILYYESGEEFLQKNSLFLSDTYPCSCFMLENGKHMSSRESGFNLTVEDWDKGQKVAAQRRYPYRTSIAGSVKLVPVLYDTLKSGGVDMQGVIAEEGLANEFIAYCTSAQRLSLMQYMELPESVYLDIEPGEKPTLDDVEEMVNLDMTFRRDASVRGPVYTPEAIAERIRSSISSYVVSRVDGKIVSQAKVSRWHSYHACISGAVTLPEYRNQGHMRKVLSQVAAGLRDLGFIPYLFVDTENPISNHLYRDIGFVYGPKFVEADVVL